MVPGRVNKSRYRNYLARASAWVQSASPRDDARSKWAKLKNPILALQLCSNSLAVGSYAELFGTIPGGIRLPKTVDRERCNTCWISWNLQFSGNFEGFVHISMVSDKPCDNLGLISTCLPLEMPRVVFVVQRAPKYSKTMSRYRINPKERIRLSKEEWTLSGAERRPAAPVLVLRNSAHTDQCYR